MKPATALPAYLQHVVASGAERTSGLLCPACQGGRTGERSLGLYRFETYVALKCRRLSCGYSERFALVGVEAVAGAPAPSRDTEFEGELTRVPAGARVYMHQKYGIRGDTLDLFGVRAVVGLQALHMPVWSPLAERRGATVRRFDGWGRKADSFKQSDGPWQSWYLAQEPRGLVIVEDQLSAMRCWQLGYTSVALLGTTLNDDRAQEIARHVVKPALIALDADAWFSACHYAVRYPWIDRAVLLSRDLKDVPDEEIEERLNGRNRHRG